MVLTRHNGRRAATVAATATDAAAAVARPRPQAKRRQQQQQQQQQRQQQQEGADDEVDDNAPIDQSEGTEGAGGAGATWVTPTCSDELLGRLRGPLLQHLSGLPGSDRDELKARLGEFALVSLELLDEIARTVGPGAADGWGTAALAACRLAHSEALKALPDLVTAAVLLKTLERYYFPKALFLELRSRPEWADWRALGETEARFVLLNAWLMVALGHFTVNAAWAGRLPLETVDMTESGAESETASPAAAFRRNMRTGGARLAATEQSSSSSSSSHRTNASRRRRTAPTGRCWAR